MSIPESYRHTRTTEPVHRVLPHAFSLRTCLPYREPRDIELMLQDHDRIVRSNESTSVGIVKLTKSSVAKPQEIAIERHCEHDG